MTRGRPARDAGFTLVEIILVLVVLAVAGTLALPAIQTAIDSVRAEAGVRRVASFLDDTRRRAVLERAEKVVRCRQREGDLEVGPPGGAAKPFAIPEPLSLVSCSPETLRYFPQGAASGIALTLRDGTGRERRVSVGAFTGLARIEDRP